MAEMQEKEPQTISPLAALGGKLAGSFAAASDVARLHRQILDRQNDTARPAAGAALTAFYAAAENLKSREAEFAQRSRAPETADTTPDLKINLRSPEHFAALRAFKGAGADIVALDPALGGALVKAVEKALTPQTHAHKGGM